MNICWCYTYANETLSVYLILWSLWKKNNFVIDFKILRIFDVSVSLQPDFNKNFSCHALFVGNNDVWINKT